MFGSYIKLSCGKQLAAWLLGRIAKRWIRPLSCAIRGVSVVRWAVGASQVAGVVHGLLVDGTGGASFAFGSVQRGLVVNTMWSRLKQQQQELTRPPAFVADSAKMSDGARHWPGPIKHCLIHPGIRWPFGPIIQASCVQWFCFARELRGFRMGVCGCVVEGGGLWIGWSTRQKPHSNMQHNQRERKRPKTAEYPWVDAILWRKKQLGTL